MLLKLSVRSADRALQIVGAAWQNALYYADWPYSFPEPSMAHSARLVSGPVTWDINCWCVNV